MRYLNSGPVRLLLVVLVAWTALWGGIYAYAAITADQAHKQGSNGIPDLERYVIAKNEEATALMSSAIDNSFSKRDHMNDLAELAMVVGPAGFVLIVVLSGAGWWVYRGFKKAA